MAGRGRAALIWTGVAATVLVPLGVAATSPLLAFRDPIYVVAGFAGVLGLALILLQPLLAAGLLPRLDRARSRRLHLWVGVALISAVLIHVGGLWLTSPPDVIDALTFTSPTPFSAWGVVAMWALFAAGALAALRRRLRLPPTKWRQAHAGLAVVVVFGTVVHALLIEGTMGPLSKLALCVLTLGAMAGALIHLRIFCPRRRRR